MSPQEIISFEEAFERIEQIVEKMHSGTVGLEGVMDLFEEGEGLIQACHARIADCEQRIETLVKQRGKLTFDQTQKPKREPYLKPSPSSFSLRDEPNP
jgi:exodeoxyribonuclease VII small subunit